MTPEMIQLIIAIVGLVVQYGPEAVAKAITILNKDAVTLEDIDALRGLCKPPEEY